MHPTDICSYVRANGLEIPDTFGRRCFRCSARLVDGTELPCVVVREGKSSIDLFESQVGAIRGCPSDGLDRLLGDVRSLYGAALLGGNRVDLRNIASLGPSRHAIPWALLETLPGVLDWQPLTFAGVTADGAEFLFHTAGEVAFFEMPERYSGLDLRSLARIERAIAGAHRERDAFAAVVLEADFGELPTRAR